ncbi:hypothetical protein B0H11DRAFT_2065091 [Mycena galericulata]|nr:hypothetical protein B0H11DRAFT_2065091 [Mycena galericulata]
MIRILPRRSFLAFATFLRPSLPTTVFKFKPAELHHSRIPRANPCISYRFASTFKDPNARLTQDTLKKVVELFNNLKSNPKSSTDKDLTFLLQYLKSADIPPRDVSCCAHTLGLSHAQFSLYSLALILRASQTEIRPPIPHPVQRVVQSWPEIEKWIQYVFTDWIFRGKFLGQQEEDRARGFNAIIPFLMVASRVPELRELLLARGPNQMTTLLTLVGCWSIEAEEWFMKNKGYALHHSAAPPLSTLFGDYLENEPAIRDAIDAVFNAPEIQSAPALVDFFRAFEMMGKVSRRSHADIARTALTLLRNPSLPLHVLHAHLRMLNLIATVTEYCDALLAQHSIRHVTRTLSELTSRPYDYDTAPEVAQCIASCVRYLTTYIPKKDGFHHVREALQAGLLPAILRWGRPYISQQHDDHSKDKTHAKLKLLHMVSLYIVYPSVLRPFLASARKIDQLGLIDVATSDPVSAAYLKVVNIATDRLTMIRPGSIDLRTRCENCGKEDIDADFRSCSGCFIPSYCSENCQTVHWKEKHEAHCKEVQKKRKEGLPLIPMSDEDLDYISQFAMAQVNRNRAEIVRVWKEEGPTRTPLVSFDFTEDPNGVMVVGARCLDTTPGDTATTGVYIPELHAVVNGKAYFRSIWEEAISRPVHDQDAIVCIFLPQGDTPQAKLSFIGIKSELNDTEGTVYEKLVKTIEDGIEYGLPGPPVL